MATVFVARDLKHERRVAVKVLLPELAAALGADRFLREIRIAAALQHPNILVLHDSGEADGILYYVMPLVEGESLRERLERSGPLPLEEALTIAGEVADALGYAHGRGFVHRDVKPENILLTGSGHALVADFGIARAITAVGGEHLTDTGIAVGTPAYMSPEQFMATDPVDGRADIYALGCVLYEMLAGTPPFTGPSVQAVLARHTVDPVPSVRAMRRDLPDSLEQVVGRALAKLPNERYQTAAEFRAALQGPGGTRPLKSSAGLVPTRAWIWAAAAAVVVFGVGAWLDLRGRTTPAGAVPPSVAVLPFRNLSADPNDAAFSDGMSEELSTSLTKVAGLRVASVAAADLSGKASATPAQMGRALGVTWLLEGTVRRADARWRVTARLVSAQTGLDRWAEQYESPTRDVFSVQDSITRRIVRALQLQFSSADSGALALARRRTANPEAHELYLQGRYFYEKRDEPGLRQALTYFARAIAKDSNYALAWSGLADTYSFLTVFGYEPPHAMFPKATAAAERALALDSLLPEAHTSRGFIALFWDWDWPLADAELRRAQALNPSYTPPILFHAWYNVAVGRTDSAVADMRRATALEPLSLILNTRLASMLFWARRYREADSVLHQVLTIDSSYALAHTLMTRVYLHEGMCPQALAEARSRPLVAHYEGAAAAYAAASCGDRAGATRIVDSLRAASASGKYVAPEIIALIYAGLGEKDRAFQWFDKAFADHTWSLYLLKVDPMLDGLHGDPRFERLVKAVGLP